MLLFNREYNRLKKRYAQGRWSESLITDARVLLDKQRNSPALALYLAVKQSITGFDKASAEHLYQLSQTPDYEIALKEQLTILMICLQSGLHAPEECQQKLMLLSSKSGFQHALRYFPALLLVLPDESRYRSMRNKSVALETRLSTIDQFIEQSCSDSIAVVGNSPREMGNGYGPEIDRHELVIRFNNLTKLCDHSADYGQKTDLWIQSPAFRTDPASPVCHDIGISGQDPRLRPTRYWERLSQLDNQLYCFPSATWHQLVKQLEAPPSAGLLTLATLASSEHNTFRLSIYGFSEIQDEPNQTNHYSDRTPRSERHNWDEEAKMIRFYRDYFSTEQQIAAF